MAETNNLKLALPTSNEYVDVEVLNENFRKIDTSVLLALAAAVPYSAAATYAQGAYCTKDGKLYRCTVAILQAEAWNAAHWTATTVGAELVAIYTTLANKAPATHADQHAKGGADPITPESIGAAPGGYGSGDYGKMLTADDDLNTLTVGGHYLFFGNSIPQNAPTGLIDWTAYVIENLPYNELVTAQILHIIVPDLTYGYGKYSNCSLRRTRYGDTYTPWAWINPPMELGVEYMTTEHHIGKPVYCKLVDLGEGTNGKTVNVGTTEMVHVECRATYSRWSLPMPELPFGSTDRSLEHTNAQAFYSNANTVTIIKGSTCPAFTATAKVYYIKSTD
nr:MAG TPA: hypothetical protein [Caudoviricetes sp.]